MFSVSTKLHNLPCSLIGGDIVLCQCLWLVAAGTGWNNDEGATEPSSVCEIAWCEYIAGSMGAGSRPLWFLSLSSRISLMANPADCLWLTTVPFMLSKSLKQQKGLWLFYFFGQKNTTSTTLVYDIFMPVEYLYVTKLLKFLHS